LAASFAHAQSTEKDADAERLFKEAQTLMEARKFAEACPKLESAYRKDQQLGTLINLAYCHKEMGAPWLSWVEFREAEAKATELKRDDRRDFARQKMKELEKGLTKLMVDPTTKVELYEVDVEDRHVFDAEKSAPFFAESGQRKVTFHAKGKKVATSLVNVGSPKDKMQHIPVPDMVDEDPVVATVETPPTTPVKPVDQPPPTTESSGWSTQKYIALGVGGLGVVGVVVGSIFGIKTLTGKCTDGPGGDPCTRSDRADVSSTAAVSTAAFIAGGALLAGGIVLWVTAPSGSTTSSASGLTVRAEAGPTWAGVHGTF
jgi:hypothetical protein